MLSYCILINMNTVVLSVCLGILYLFIIQCHGTDTKCSESSYRCHDTFKCISAKYQCDGDKDCPLGDDEEDCDDKVSGCGDLSKHFSSNGSISSMGYPSSYYNLADCRWHLEIPDGRKMTLTFDDLFDLEKSRHGECVYDKINVFQENPLVLIGEYCGNKPPPPIHINSSKAVVEFLSDRDNVGQGFRLSWTPQETASTSPPVMHHTSLRPPSTTTTTIASKSPLYHTSTTSHPPTTASESLCAFVVNKGGVNGLIRSPSLVVGEYPSSPTTCRWLISVNPGSFIALDFNNLHLSNKFSPIACAEAFLKVYNGADENAPLIDKLCGHINPGEILSTSNSMFLVLSAPNGLSNNINFEAQYIAKRKQLPTTLGPDPPGCDGTPIILTSKQGFIASPNFDGVTKYRTYLDCRWLLVGTPGEVFTFSFEDFAIEHHSSGCIFDYVRIVDNVDGNVNGSSVDYLNKTLCSLRLPSDVESKTANVTVTFHSDDQVTGVGFNMTYKLGPPAVVCPEDQFKCGSDECINTSLVCDGVRICKDGSDEIACPASTSCGKPPIHANLHDLRILGGTEAVVGAWPWTVSLLSPEGEHLCGASLILSRWVITAAHCFDYVFDSHYEAYSIMAGRHELRHPSRNEQRRFVDNVYIPLDYISSTSQNDIALIKLVSPFDLSDTVNTVCLPEKEVDSDLLGWILGWGDTFNTCCAGKLKQATVPRLNHTLCKSYYEGRLYDHMMCAGYPEGGTDSCHGDSGGPYVTQHKQDGRWELQGITSWGGLCGLPQSPGVYTIVHDFLEWIQQTIAENTA